MSREMIAISRTSMINCLNWSQNKAVGRGRRYPIWNTVTLGFLYSFMAASVHPLAD